MARAIRSSFHERVRARASRGLVPGADRCRSLVDPHGAEFQCRVTLSAAGKSRSAVTAPLTGVVVDQADARLAGARVTRHRCQRTRSSRRRQRMATATVQRSAASRTGRTPSPSRLPLFIAGRAAGHRAANGRAACPASRAHGWRFLGRRRSHRPQGGDTNRRDAAEGRSRSTRRIIERTVAADLTDVLKKNAGVDVIQYSGRALRHRHSRIPAAVLGHQQALAAAHRRPPVRRDQSRRRCSWTTSIASRSSRARPRRSTARRRWAASST